MFKKKWVLLGLLVTTSTVLVACGSDEEADAGAETPDIEGTVDEGEHIEEFDVEFEDNEEFEELDEDELDIPAGESDRDGND